VGRAFRPAAAFQAACSRQSVLNADLSREAPGAVKKSKNCFLTVAIPFGYSILQCVTEPRALASGQEYDPFTGSKRSFY